MRCKIIGTIGLVLGIIIIVSTGTTFAYFSATASSGEGVIEGTTKEFNVELESRTILKAQQLVPLEDKKILSAVNSQCIDLKGYEVCSLYELTLTNTGEAKVLNGYISTTNITYITNNLRCQLFDSDYNAVSDIITLSSNSDKFYFKSGENLISAAVNNEPIVYYLAIWLTETGDYQDDDYAKEFSGKVYFESLNGGKVYADFTA